MNLIINVNLIKKLGIIKIEWYFFSTVQLIIFEQDAGAPSVIPLNSC